MSDYDPPSLMRRPDPGWASRPRPGRGWYSVRCSVVATGDGLRGHLSLVVDVADPYVIPRLQVGQAGRGVALDGECRLLGIPTVLDRNCLTALIHGHDLGGEVPRAHRRGRRSFRRLSRGRAAGRRRVGSDRRPHERQRGQRRCQPCGGLLHFPHLLSSSTTR